MKDQHKEDHQGKLKQAWSLGTMYFAHVRVKALEPRSELFIVNQGIGGVKDDLHALPVGKALEEHLEFWRGGFETTILREI